MDVKQQATVTKGGGPDTNPMNLTCKPASGAVPEDTRAAIDTAVTGATKYAVVINGSSPAAPPNNTWAEVFVSTEDYKITSSDGSISFTIPAGDLGIYSK